MSVRIALVALAAGLACFPSTAGATLADPPLGGALTITGTAGKDDFEVRVFIQTPHGGRLTIEPAAQITAASGTCSPYTDPLTGRPTSTECRLATSSASTLFVDLRAGDDRVAIEDAEGVLTSMRVSGGAGNDTIQVTAPTTRTLQGDDGNDLLAAPGRMGETPGQNRPVAYEGGAGIDTASFDDSRLFKAPNTTPIGVVASLATNTAVFSGLNSSNQQTTFRTDTLSGIEGLAGTELGDVLTGSAGQNTLFGDEGNDNLNGGDGDDDLQGGDDLDALNGGNGHDSLDGGLGIDTYARGAGGDTYLTRDGYTESITCVSGDVIIDDLADTIAGDPRLCTVSTAAAKHHYDTKLSGRQAKIKDGALVTKVRCPALKTETCEGKLEALLGRRELGHSAYKVRPGNKAGVRLPISNADARRVAGRKILLSASETDADKRDRFVSRPTRVAKSAGGRGLSRPR